MALFHSQNRFQDLDLCLVFRHEMQVKPAGIQRIHKKAQLIGRCRTADQQRSIRILNHLKIRNHVLYRDVERFDVDLKAAKLFDLKKGIQKEHGGGVQMDKVALKLFGDHPVHRLYKLSIKIRREDSGGVFLHPDDADTGRQNIRHGKGGCVSRPP